MNKAILFGIVGAFFGLILGYLLVRSITTTIPISHESAEETIAFINTIGSIATLAIAFVVGICVYYYTRGKAGEHPLQ